MRFVDVCHTECRCIKLVGRSHAGYDGNVETMTTLDKFKFRTHRIDTIHNIIKQLQINCIRIFGKIEHLVFVNNTVAIDIKNTLFCNINLVFPYC